MYLQDALGMDEADFAEELKATLLDYLLGNIDYAVLGETPRGIEVILLHEFLKGFPPDIRENIRQEVVNTKVEDLYNIDEMRQSNRDCVELIRLELKNDGIFCSTSDDNNLLMWAHYADRHKGVPLWNSHLA